MIRHATHDDLPAILDMGERFHKAGRIDAPYDRGATERFVRGMLVSGAVLMSKRGMIGGMLVPAYCSNNWLMAVELFWWSEDRRGLSLLRAFEGWAAGAGASEVRMTTLAGLSKADGILGRLGYAPKETSYTKVI